MSDQPKASKATRREFLSSSGKAIAAASLASAIAARSYAAEDNTIKLALVGCGGRGTGAAANALQTKGPTKLVALADVFSDRLEGCCKTLAQKFGDKVDVPPDRRFIGMDAFKKAIDLLGKGDLVLLATPPAFRPIHVEYAEQKDLNVFMEKSFAVDAPGIRRVFRAGELAQQKNLKIAGGLMCRHNKPLEEAIKQIHDGIIGDVITCWAYRMHTPVGFHPRQPGMSELLHQIRNYSNFTWTNGSFLLDWLIHNIDVCCWTKNAWPVSAQGQGGRRERTEPDQLFDHYAAEYTFPDGTRLFAQGRHMNSCYGFFGDIIHGTKGCAVIGEGVQSPKIYKGFNHQSPENLIWEFKGPRSDPYQNEHDLLFEAIRENKAYNETERCARAAMTGILGRMAVESGQVVTFDQALKSEVELAPGLEQFTLESKAPVMPDEKGNYPLPQPGKAKVV